MERKVPFFNYPYLFESDQEELTRIMLDVCHRGAYILQKDLEAFEKSLASYAGAKYAVGVADGTEAITIALIAAGLKQGDEVIFTSHTFIATAAAIHQAGGIPIPVDCGSDHMMDVTVIEQAITPRTKALVPTQLNGRVCNMDAIMSIAEKHNLFIVEDAAQALGAKYKGKSAGTFGVAGTISFYPAKSLGCFGDGGAVLMNDEKIYKTVKCLRDHGRDDSGEIVMWGFNSRLDNLQAAILNHKLSSFDNVISRRREIAARYNSKLSELKQLHLPPAPGSEKDHFDTFQNYEIEAENRDALQVFLKERGVGTLIQWGGKAVHQFKKLGFKVSLPYTEQMFTKCIMIPLNMALSNEDVDYVADCIRDFYSR